LDLLPAYLELAPEGSDDAHKYRWIPRVSHQFAFECSNRYKHIFTKNGKNKIIKDLNVCIMTSEVNATDYKKLQNISAYLKGEILSCCRLSKNIKLVQWDASATVQSFL